MNRVVHVTCATSLPARCHALLALMRVSSRVFTIGHGARDADELLACLAEAGVRTLVDIRRFPGSRRHPQFNGPAVAALVEETGIAYRHAVELGGRLSGEPGEERFACITVAA